MEMNILFSSDDNYVQHLGVAMFSLLDKNRGVSKIHLFVVNNHIEEENIARLQQIVSMFSNADLHFLSFDNWASSLDLKMAWPISISAYARLFAADMLPESIDRVLYLDCDMVINADLTELWNSSLNDCCIGAVQDQVSSQVKTKIGMKPNDPYFNSGLLLIDLKLWRENKYGEQCLEFIDKHHGYVVHHDQGVLNGLFEGRWVRLPLKYNVMTIHYFFNQRQILKYFNDDSPFYSGREVNLSVKTPVILHYTPSFTTHPWETGCFHPQKDIYRNNLQYTPWASSDLYKAKTPWYQKLINWRYRNLPY